MNNCVSVLCVLLVGSCFFAGCASTGVDDGMGDIPAGIETVVDNAVEAVDPGSLLTNPPPVLPEADPLEGLGLQDLSTQWGGTRTAGLFIAIGKEIKRSDLAAREDLRYGVMKYLGRPDTSSLLAKPSFLAYNLPDGRTAQVTFPSASSADWEVFGSLREP